MRCRAFLAMLVALSCLFCMGCDEFGVLNLIGETYLSLPNTNSIELQWNIGNKENYNNHITLSSDFVDELQAKYPKEEFFQDLEPNCVYGFFLDEYLKTRKNFMLTISVKYNNETFSGDILIPYIKDEGEIINFSLFSQSNEKIDGIFIYEFWQFI